MNTALLQPLTLGDTGAVLPLPTATSQLLCTPNWDTKVYFTTYTSTHVTVAFTVSAPSGGELDCIFVDTPYSGQVSVTETDTTKTISISATEPFEALVQANWATEITVTRTTSEIDLVFSVAAPAGALVSWATHEGGENIISSPPSSLFTPPAHIAYASYQVGWDDFNNGGYVIASDSGFLYVAVGKSAYAESRVIKIDKPTVTVVHESIDLNGGSGIALRLSPDGTRLYCVCANSSTTMVTLSTTDLSVLNSTSVAHNNPASFDISPDGTKFVVSFYLGASTEIMVLDTAAFTTTNFTIAGSGVRYLVFCYLDSSNMYLSQQGSDVLTKYDLSGGTHGTHTIGLIAGSPEIDTMRMHPLSGFMFGGDSSNNVVFCFDPLTDTKLNEQSVARYIDDIAFDPNGPMSPSSCYAMSNQTPDLYIFNDAGSAVVTKDFANTAVPFNQLFSGVTIDGDGVIYTTLCPDDGGGDDSLVIETLGV